MGFGDWRNREDRSEEKSVKPQFKKNSGNQATVPKRGFPPEDWEPAKVDPTLKKQVLKSTGWRPKGRGQGRIPN